VTTRQIRHGLKLADDLRRIKNAPSGIYVVLQTTVPDVLNAIARLEGQK
jgi:hypothetical protein